MDIRYSQRVQSECSVVFAADSLVGEARMRDLSIPGCLLESSEKVIVGDYVRLRLFLPDQSVPLQIPLAAVRWVDGIRFGIEFIRMTKEDRIRLGQFVTHRYRLVPSSGSWREGTVIVSPAGA